jgi:hypothetical protein
MHLDISYRHLKTMRHSPKYLEIFGETCTSLEIFSEIRRRRSETG